MIRRVDAQVAAFAAVAAVLMLTPGPDFAVILRNAVHGRPVLGCSYRSTGTSGRSRRQREPWPDGTGVV